MLALLLWRFRRTAAACLIVAIAWLYVASTAWFADLVVAPLERVYPPKAMSVVPRADAIVVLGGVSRGDTHFSSMGDLNAQADRLTHAAALYRAGKAPLVLLSGGAERGNRAEAEIMHEHMELMGVSRFAMMRERESRTSHDNAVYSGIILKGKGVQSILLVTSAYHMRRAVPLFEKQGFQVIPAPADFQRRVGADVLPPWLPTAEDLLRTTQALREYVGYRVYQYRGWI